MHVDTATITITSRLKTTLMIVTLMLSIMGVVTFSLFIFEESLQTVMFGTWAAQDAKDWQLVLQGHDLNRGINATMKKVNTFFGWIQPLAWLSYRSYGQATDFYLDALQAKIFANNPALFAGRTIDFVFRPRSIIHNDKGSVLVNGKIHVVTSQQALSVQEYTVRGLVSSTDDRSIIVDATSVASY